MAYENIRLDQDGAVATLVIDRPKALNALNSKTLQEMESALGSIGSDVRVLIVTGGGEKAFVAGADIAEMAALSEAQATEFGELGHRVMAALELLPIPTIAAVNGFALGGGCELALACDLRYAATSAKLGQPEVNLGIFPGWGGTQRLARVCGLGVAKDLILTGRVVDADEALRIGLVNGVFEPEELMEKTLEVARTIASKGPLAVAAAKVAINHALQGDHVENLQAEADSFGELFSSEDAREGMTAFIEKREPDFSGR
jgi:enoyl-CoA hydratase